MRKKETSEKELFMVIDAMSKNKVANQRWERYYLSIKTNKVQPECTLCNIKIDEFNFGGVKEINHPAWDNPIPWYFCISFWTRETK